MRSVTVSCRDDLKHLVRKVGIGDLFGSIRYLGQCFVCGRQFASTHEYAYFIPGKAFMHCERCAKTD